MSPIASPLVITRMHMPEVSQLGPEPRYEDVGGQWEWCWALALPYRALMSPSTAVMPAAPPDRDVDFFPYLSYWNSLQSFLTFSFAWTRHDRGLRWWYDNGKPTEDARLALISAVWERDGMLLRYLEWCHARLENGVPHVAKHGDHPYEERADDISAEWKARLRSARPGSSGPGNPHGKHLEMGTHSSGPMNGPGPAKLVEMNSSDRRAVLHLETALGWYGALIELGKFLPHDGGPSWRIDVWVKPVGFMGTYRRSRKTGLWFAGRHRYHSVGQ